MSTFADNCSPPPTVGSLRDYTSDDFTENILEAMQGKGQKRYSDPQNISRHPKHTPRNLQPSVEEATDSFTENILEAMNGNGKKQYKDHYEQSRRPKRNPEVSQHSIISDARRGHERTRITRIPQTPSEISCPSTSAIIGEMLNDKRPFKPTTPKPTITSDKALIAHLQAEFYQSKREMEEMKVKIATQADTITAQNAALTEYKAEIVSLRHQIYAKDSAAQAMDEKVTGQINKLIGEREELKAALMLTWAESECPGEKDKYGRQKYRYKYAKRG